MVDAMNCNAIAIILVLILVAPSGGDEILLRDGRRIPWKTVTDEGEVYAVETKDGGKLKLKKSEVEKFIVDRPESKPLAGSM